MSVCANEQVPVLMTTVGLNNGRAVREGSVDVEEAREYELPQHQLGSESEDEDGVQDAQYTRQSVESEGEGRSSGRRLI